MKQGQSIAYSMPGGALKITECSNTTNIKLPSLTIFLAATPPTLEEPPYPAESISLSHVQVSALEKAIADYRAGNHQS